MIKLAFAIAFLAVFGLCGYALIVFLWNNLNPKQKENQESNKEKTV